MTIPTFAAFQTANRALTASQTLLNVTGNNIANVNTEGYTRQRVDLTSIYNSGLNQKFANVATTSTSQGVEATGVSQIRDVFLDNRYRAENSDNSKYTAIKSGLSDLMDIVDEIRTDGLQSQLADFGKQLETLSESPTDKDIALTVRTSAQSLTSILNSYAQQVTEVRDQAIYDLKAGVVTDFNSVVESIANLNTQIKEEEINGNTPNELYDKRNALIDQLSGYAKIKVTTSTEEISSDISVANLNISLYDETSGTSIKLVEDGKFSTISLDTDGDTVKVQLSSTIDNHDSDITDHFTSGSIKGYLDVINGEGSYASTDGNDFRGTLYYMHALDTFASTFADTFNTLNDTDTTDTADDPLFAASDGSSKITALNIAVSDQWLKDSMAINSAAYGAASGDNTNVLRMIKALSSNISFTDAETGLKFNGSFTDYMTGVVAELSSDISLNDDYLDTSDSVLSSLAASRDSVSGVSLDEEGVNLLAYQKSYNAAARFMTVLDEMMDRLINDTGVVGR
jgi:flagellar hook-associated protein FlgK